jgi:hypothetical protein
LGGLALGQSGPRNKGKEGSRPTRWAELGNGKWVRSLRKTAGLHKTIGKVGKEKSHGPALRIQPKWLLGIEIPYYFQALL